MSFDLVLPYRRVIDPSHAVSLDTTTLLPLLSTTPSFPGDVWFLACSDTSLVIAKAI
ncbi:hypothetical protein [Microvirga sp. TS319]|uniref:hypothetical protein n=1 Tax=Microvirga sp. TS319 TaxID=3241165 RepID=UPI00351A793E